MCTPKASTAAADQANQQAQEARLREDQRVLRVRAGQEQINRLFDKGETFTQGGTENANNLILNPADPRFVGMSVPDVQAYLKTPFGMTTRQDNVFVPQGTQPGEGTWAKTTTAFDDAFYDQRRQAGLGYYVPQLAQQFQTAREQMGYALARAGLSRSTVAGEKFNKLQGDYDIENAGIASKVETDVNGLRTQVEDARSGLLTSLAATSDPESTATQALGRAQVLASAPVNYSPLGDIFAGITGTIGAGVSGYQNAQTTALLNNAVAGGTAGRPRSRAVVVGR
jgi:hypothetical protein